MGFLFTSSVRAVLPPTPVIHGHNLNGPKPYSLISMSCHRRDRHLPSKSSSISYSTLTSRGSIISCNSHRKPRITICASSNNTLQASSSSADGKLILISSALTVTLAVANRVLYKLALVPMKQYPFFLAQLSTFGYVVIYFSILYARYRMGIVTDEMIGLPKSRFMAIGILEALGVASGMASAAMLPGPAIPILNQTFLVWQLALSAVLLGRKYTLNQIGGCLLVAAGVVVAVGRCVYESFLVSYAGVFGIIFI